MRDAFGDQIVSMLLVTFQDFGTQLQQFRQTCRQQDQRIKELLGANQVLARECADWKDRLEALREVRRKEQRAELEHSIIMPGDSRLKGKKS